MKKINVDRQIKTIEQLRDSRLLYEKDIPAFGYLIVMTVMALLGIVVVWSIYTSKTYMVISEGTVQSENKNFVMPQYTGEISDICITEGNFVEKGDVLFKITSGDINMQETQLAEQKKSYEAKASQYQKLVESIKDDTNYFDSANVDDNLYYSQFEAYKSQVAQNQMDVSTYQSYGYTEEQIESQLIANEAKVTELYYSAIQVAESSREEAKTQIKEIEAQQTALNEGQKNYVIKASETGIIHMLSDYKEGMVVQAASAVASIASEQDEYTVVSYVSAQDIAKIQVGDKADIAVSGLLQSVYGTITADVIGIDSDITLQNEENREKGAYFKVYVKPKSTYLVSKEGNKVNISNGMTVETRIQYDEITYFDYIMEVLGVLTR